MIIGMIGDPTKDKLYELTNYKEDDILSIKVASKSSTREYEVLFSKSANKVLKCGCLGNAGFHKFCSHMKEVQDVLGEPAKLEIIEEVKVEEVDL